MLTEFGRDGWGEGGEEFAWWCTEAPRRSPAREPVYQSMETELRMMLGDDVYEEVVKYCDARLDVRAAADAASGRGQGVARAHPHPQAVDRGRRRRRDRRRASSSTISTPSSASCRTVVARDRRRRVAARRRPRAGWDVRDTIAHLADTDEMAIDTATGGPGAINDVAARAASGEDVTYRGVLRGRRLAGRRRARVVGRARRRPSATMLRALDPDARVPWGIGMRAPSFVTARLMETWAHGLDVRAALGVAAVDTDRLAHVAWLATRALPYAYSVAGREPPAEPAPGRARRCRRARRGPSGPADARRTASPARRASTAGCSCTG